ncbi:hypothetical protein QVD17_01801 [Tagetes erecta]|uniref:S-adenosylmethionine decarboxylase proenzyme n=1 Tax=Tagetes erecta TaxID=13708 RepID=A0AAD8LB90_TARER|nr:hypothetical protein QVD17_01801 [Tagetes erecta]
MAVSGFEGFEKRLELQFSCDQVSSIGLRELDFKSLEQVLHHVQCTVVSALANQHFDSYVLSESSLFVYPTKIIIKTCGTTQLLKSVQPFIRLAQTLHLHIVSLRYTRGSFIFPESQPHPHTSFNDEVVFLNNNIPQTLCYRKASVIPSKLSSHSWHVFSAGAGAGVEYSDDVTYTVEVCMTDLDKTLSRKFFRHPNDGKNGDSAGKQMTEVTGIGCINPNAKICDFAFDPCGYSMNGIDGDRYSTIHVTPEDGFSYASFECVGSIYDDDVPEMVKKAVKVFGPGTVSVATTGAGDDVCMRIFKGMEKIGMKGRSWSIDEFLAAGTVVFQTFTSRRNRIQ